MFLRICSIRIILSSAYQNFIWYLLSKHIVVFCNYVVEKKQLFTVSKQT